MFQAVAGDGWGCIVEVEESKDAEKVETKCLSHSFKKLGGEEKEDMVQG